jgi:hypothetical protein
MRASTGKMGAKKATFIKVDRAKTTRIIKRLRTIMSIKEESVVRMATGTLPWLLGLILFGKLPRLMSIAKDIYVSASASRTSSIRTPSVDVSSNMSTITAVTAPTV